MAPIYTLDQLRPTSAENSGIRAVVSVGRSREGIPAVGGRGVDVGLVLPPEREIFAARASLNAAKDIQADLYAPEAWDKAKKAFDVADLEIEAQGEKGILVRRYDRARRLFSGAQHAAECALQAAEAGREDFRRRATTTIQTITETLSQADAIASELEKCTRNPASLRDDIEMLRDALGTQMNEAAMVKEAIASEDYAAALRLAESVSEEGSHLLDELQEAKARSRC